MRVAAGKRLKKTEGRGEYAAGSVPYLHDLEHLSTFCAVSFDHVDDGERRVITGFRARAFM
jgi:hypothetical protein